MPDLIKDVPCLVCGKMLEREEDVPVCERVDGWWCYGIVYDGVICRAQGNYGSTAYDPFVDTPAVVFAICDDCFRTLKDRMVILEASMPDHPQDVINSKLREKVRALEAENAKLKGAPMRAEQVDKSGRMSVPVFAPTSLLWFAHDEAMPPEFFDPYHAYVRPGLWTGSREEWDALQAKGTKDLFRLWHATFGAGPALYPNCWFCGEEECRATDCAVWKQCQRRARERG